MREIQLSNSDKVVFVDDEDYDLLSQYTWTAWNSGSNKWYAVSGMNRGKYAKPILMHRLIMNAAPNEQVDHINGDGFDNRKSVNLRIVTTTQQSYNKLPQRGKLYSAYKGVTWCKTAKKWRAQIMKLGKNYSLGYFNSEIDAAKAYDLKAIELFGEYARPNFVEGGDVND